MNKEQWQRIETVFYSAMELPRNDRDDYVRQACAGDEELRREVQALLDANRDTESFLDSPAAMPQQPAPFTPTRVKYCPKCNQTYPTSLRVCQNDQEVLSLKDPYHLVGRTLIDKYRITALVGLGGMGAVYCAHHLGIDRRVAFKILQPNVAIGSEYVVGLFEREAKLAGRLSHENIVDVKDAGHTPDGVSYIAMEWLEGRTLDDELSNQGRFGFKRAIGIIRQIANALGEAHAKHVVHRDLKPGNIMLLDTPDGRDHLKVLDFGIGKVIEESTANSPVSALVGTPQYASPEQLTIGGHVDGRSDIYSLGVIFYRILSGQAPFNCSSIGELLQMQLTAMPKPLGEIRPETPLSIERLINDMLEKDPARRPQNAGEVLKRLDQLPDEPVTEEFAGGDGRKAPRAAEAVDALKRQELARQITEDIVGIPPHPISDSRPTNRDQRVSEVRSEAETLLSAPKSAGRNRLYLLYGMTILAVVFVSGYGLYRYRFNESGNPRAISEERVSGSGLNAPSSSPTQAVVTDSQPNSTANVGAVPQASSNQALSQPGQQPSPAPSVNKAENLATQRKAAEYLRRARELHHQGDHQGALRECNEALRLNPSNDDARRLQQRIKKFIEISNRP